MSVQQTVTHRSPDTNRQAEKPRAESGTGAPASATWEASLTSHLRHRRCHLVTWSASDGSDVTCPPAARPSGGPALLTFRCTYSRSGEPGHMHLE